MRARTLFALHVCGYRLQQFRSPARKMADLLEAMCCDVLQRLRDSVVDGAQRACVRPLARDDESALRSLSKYVRTLRGRTRFAVRCLDEQLRHRLFDLTNLILLTDVGELSLPDGGDFLLDLLNLCDVLKPDPAAAYRADRARLVHVDVVARTEPPLHWAFVKSDVPLARADEDRVHPIDSDGCGHHNQSYASICDLLESYVQRNGGGGGYFKLPLLREEDDMWERIEQLVAQFEVRDPDECCVRLRERLDEVAEATQLLTVVEGGTPLAKFLQPQADDIYAALKQDAWHVLTAGGDGGGCDDDDDDDDDDWPMTPEPADYVKKVRRRRRHRLRRWLERVFYRMARRVHRRLRRLRAAGRDARRVLAEILKYFFDMLTHTLRWIVFAV